MIRAHVCPRKVVICEGFRVNYAAFTAYTITPFLGCNLFCFATLAFQFRKQVPPKLTHVPYRHPSSALRDPVGALVGSFMVGATLILYLILSFFGIDVWMISLPFAFAKIIFDLGWDYYRYSHGRPMVVDEDLDDESSTASHPQMEDSSSHHSLPPHTDMEQSTVACSQPDTPKVARQLGLLPDTDFKMPRILMSSRSYSKDLQTRLSERFPTFTTALPRLPFALIPFVFSQFILIEALNHQDG